MGAAWRDVPVPATDSDGKTDVAVYRPSTGGWWVLRSSTRFANYVNYPWGSGDVPVAAGYDGDSKADPLSTARRLAAGGFSGRRRTTADARRIWQGPLSGDQPVAADYDGDGKGRPRAIYRPTTVAGGF